MNSPVNKPIVDFIDDFRLIQPDGLIHFWSKANFIYKGVSHEFHPQVVVVTIRPKKLDAIYLFDNDIVEAGFADMFQLSGPNIKYIEKTCLVIEQGDLTVSIFPTDQPSAFIQNDKLGPKDLDPII